MDEITNPDVHIQLIPASRAQKPVLANLLELYTHDFCDFLDLELGPDGRFGYRELDLYWSDHDRHPFLVYVDQKLAGFVLVRAMRNQSNAAIGWDMAEFFILRSHRRRGIGTEVAHEVLARFRGAWGIRVMVSNQAAYHFWFHVIEGFVGAEVAATHLRWGGKDWHSFSFESQPKTPKLGRDAVK